MSATSSSLDSSSKWLLTAFALAAVVTIGVLAHSFFSALAPPKEVVKSQLPVTAKTHTSIQQTWNAAQQSRSTVYPNKTAPTLSVERRSTVALATPTNWVKTVHMQAEDLRKKIAESDPDDAKRRTLERIDKMEKEGLLLQ